MNLYTIRNEDGKWAIDEPTGLLLVLEDSVTTDIEGERYPVRLTAIARMISDGHSNGALIVLSTGVLELKRSEVTR